jgi:N-sulfoglucosamine sulfohydrolase
MPTRFLLLLAAAAAPAVARADDKSRPNVLFVFADDWGRQAGAYAKIDGPGTISDAAKTPNFDRLAAGGVLFRNAFVNAPSCTPCRSSIVSGQYFWRTGRGAILQGARWDETIPTWPLLLRDAGYQLGKSYKVWSPGSPADAPIGKQQYAFQKAGGRVNQFSQNATKLVAAGKSVAEAKAELLAETRDNFKALLAATKPGRPFAYWYGPTNTHRLWVKGSGQALWDIDPDTLKGKLPPFLPDVPEVREDVADYLGEAAAFDAQLGVLVDELKASGRFDNTLIAVSGDHGPAGFPQGKCNLRDFGCGVALAVRGPGVTGGRVVDDLVSLPDLAPTFLEAAGLTPPAVMTAKTLGPVLKSAKSGTVDPARDAVYLGRERHYESARPGYMPYPARAIRTADFLYVRNFAPDRYPLGDPYRLDGDDAPQFNELAFQTHATLRDDDAGPTKAWIVTHRDSADGKPFFDRAYGKRPAEELFDLKRDPHEMTNVAGDPKYAADLAKLRDRLMTTLKTTGDPRVTDGGKFFETPPLAGPLPADSPKGGRPKK